MADILAAFDELERQEEKAHPKKAPKPTNNKFRNPLLNNRNTSASRGTNSSNQRQGRSQERPRSLPAHANSKSNGRTYSPSPANSNLLAPSWTGNNPPSERSPSVASGRRISFVEGPRPPSTQHRLRLITKRDSLASGFQYDPKLKKYNVSEQEWSDFCDGVISRAELPRGATWAWRLHKNDAIRKVKRDMQYEGSDMKRYFNAWNRNFRRKGFTVSIEVPSEPKIRETDTEEQKQQVKKEAKFFRMVVTPNAEKAGSIYSRTSSLTRGVSNEGLSLQPSKTPVEDDVDEAGGGDEAAAEQAQVDETESAMQQVKEALAKVEIEESKPGEDGTEKD